MIILKKEMIETVGRLEAEKYNLNYFMYVSIEK